ncbi:MAG: hypothetical protein ACKO7B_08625, partial [Flavobacteriales bacterium]
MAIPSVDRMLVVQCIHHFIAVRFSQNRCSSYRSINTIALDDIYRSIAAASILAKTHRDEMMDALHYQHSVYGWNRNRGYPTKDHR